MPYHYDADNSDTKSSTAKKDKKEMKKEPKKSSGKLSDKQKADLKKHMEKHKDLKDMTPSQLKSHRMKMMTRMRKGMSISAAHKDIKK
tara:strand:+ start:569 stop:832 length:264 start_codon:yes stop_codon:yes gene_type:complete